MAVLTKDAILRGVQAFHTDEVDVPEWGGTVRIREMSAAMRDAFEVAMAGAVQSPQRAPRSWRAWVAANSIVDAEGVRLFGDADIEQLAEAAASAMDRIFEAVLKLSGINWGSKTTGTDNKTAAKKG